MSNQDRLRGKRYIAFARCSTNEQRDTSIPDQLKVLRAFADEHEMVCAGTIDRDVTGSVPGARTEFDDLVARKKSKNDFEVLLVQDISRLTRAGAEHGHAIEYQLNAAGIEILYVADRLPEGDHSSILKSVNFYAAKQYAKSLSFAVARGMMTSIERGRIAHCLRNPYGIDRLILSLDGKPLHVIRNLDDGTQVRLDPESGTVLATYPANCREHYRQQANERAVLIPGEPKRVEAVRLDLPPISVPPVMRV